VLTYAIYCRRSQESDERQVQSLPDQLKACHRIQESGGLFVVETFTESMSAKEPYRRDDFSRLIKLIELGTVQGVITWHPDRLSRNEIDAAQITYLVRKGKLLDLKFGNYTFDNSPEGVMMLQMALSQSQYFSSKLARDVKRGMDSKVDVGWAPQRVPEGYRNITVMQGISPLKKIDRDRKRFALIRMFWDLMLTGSHTVVDACRILNEEYGYSTRPSKNRGGGPLSVSAAYRLLDNVFYTGYFRRNGRTYKGAHPVMVSVEEFEAVQRIMERTGQLKPKKREYAYTGLIRCTHCGSMVTASVSHGHNRSGTYVYYHCTNGKGGCDKKGLPEERLEGIIAAELSRIRIDARVLDFCMKVIAGWQRGVGRTATTLKEQRTSALVEARRKLDSLLDLRLREMVSDETFSKKQAVLQEEIVRLERVLNNETEEVRKAAETATNALTFRTQAAQHLLVGSVQEKREIASALVEAVTFDQGAISIALHPAIVPITKIEPMTTGSQSTKKTALEPSFPSGAPDGNTAEHLFAFFVDKPPFPRVECLFRQPP
jgi:site-specific DNA recombinase